MIDDFEYREYERVKNMNTTMTLVVEGIVSSEVAVVEKKETYKKSELVSLREEIASYVEEIKHFRAEARKLEGRERHAKHLFIRGLSEAVRWRYLCYALLRGRDITNVERTFRDNWRRTHYTSSTILAHIPKDQHRYWTRQEIIRRLDSPYVYDAVRFKFCSIGKENP